MTIENLVQGTLQRQAELVVDHGLAVRGAAARRRAQALRARRRVVGAAVVGLAVVVAAATMVGAESLQRDDGPDPSDLSTRIVTVHESYAGRTLIASAEATGGQDLTLRAGSARGSEWLLTCTGVSGDYSIQFSLDGNEGATASCKERAALGDTWRFRLPSGSAVESQLHVWTTRTSDGVRATPAGVVLAAAAYALPDPEATVAGTDIYPLEENFGAEWEVLGSKESEPGQRSVTMDVPRYVGASMLELLSAGSGEAEVRLVVDGVRVHTDPPVYVLGGSSIGDMLTGGQPHRVTLYIQGTVPPDARLGIVVRGRVPPSEE
jgi:hypothetical protein